MILHKLVHGLNESQPFLKPLNETFFNIKKKTMTTFITKLTDGRPIVQ